jgi:hypothetical protein
MHLTPHMAFKNAPLNKKGKACKKGKTLGTLFHHVTGVFKSEVVSAIST